MSPVSARPTPAWLSIGLAFIGGYADCASYVLAQTFTGHITGNTVLAMISLAQSAWPSLVLRGLAIAFYVLGTAFGAGWNEKIRGSVLVTPLFAEAALLALSTWLLLHIHFHPTDVFVAGLCLTLGLQNGALRKTEGIGVHTTFMTGMITKILAKNEDDKPGEGPQIATLWGIFLTFVAGAITAALFTLRWKGHGVWPGVGYLVALGVVDLIVSLRRASHEA
jgi:uncharacterized membrane protein YoaK (UPF0700 family)